MPSKRMMFVEHFKYTLRARRNTTAITTITTPSFKSVKVVTPIAPNASRIPIEFLVTFHRRCPNPLWNGSWHDPLGFHRRISSLSESIRGTFCRVNSAMLLCKRCRMWSTSLWPIKLMKRWFRSKCKCTFRWAMYSIPFQRMCDWMNLTSQSVCEIAILHF